jgi:hypothetical protein
MRDTGSKTLYGMWLQQVESKVSDLKALETAFGAIEGADQVRECVQRAKAFLANWRAPALSTAVGLRVWQVSDEEADQLRDILNAKDRPCPRACLRRDLDGLQELDLAAAADGVLEVGA